MPEIFRIPLRMDCSGIDLVHPLDRMPPGAFPYLFNVRIQEEGRIDGRPGYQGLFNLSPGDFPNSIRRLNDPARIFAPDGYTYIGGGGDNLYSGIESAYAPLVGGFSGDPLSLIPFRPEQSPASWMYVYDRGKQIKIRPDGQYQLIGVSPPSGAPALEYGPPAAVTISVGSGAWTTGGTVTGVTPNNDRFNSAIVTIGSILYPGATPGWALIVPTLSSGSYYWAGERMQLRLNSGGGNDEYVTIREIHPAITTTTVQAILYDSGTIGLCSLVLAGSPDNLSRNSLVLIDSELVRILEIIQAPSGTGYSVRCSTTVAHSAGAPVVGQLSWFVYTQNLHLAGESFSGVLPIASITTGTGTASQAGALNASQASGRPIDPANDYLHISIFVVNPQLVTDVTLRIDIGDGTFNSDFYTWTIPASQLSLNGLGASADAWTDLSIPLSQGIRSGSDATKSFATISAVQFGMTTTGANGFGFSGWYFFGTYGPTIQPNSPEGYFYESRFRDSGTGATSIPGPLDRFSLFPLREEVLVTPEATFATGVDTIDIYRQGGTLSVPLYVASVANNAITPVTFSDTLPDSTILAADQSPDLTKIQPWAIQQTPWSGVVNVIGTSVERVSGDSFDSHLLAGTVILINGVAFQTFGQPTSGVRLELTLSAGVQSNATYLIASPVLFGQPLPFAFGPLEGPFAPVVFALGDPINGGLLYFSSFSDADAAADTNTLELCPPSANLVSGACWNGLVIVGNRQDLFLVRYSYLTSVSGGGSNAYQWAKIPTPSGIWSRWACCSTPYGVAFLGRDGIYLATDQGAVSISDDRLWPLFPHEGQLATPVLIGTDVILPVDMTEVNYLRLVECDGMLRFSYLDTARNSITLVYEFTKKRWIPWNFADKIWTHYLVEGSVESPNEQEILLLSLDAPKIYLAGGNDDAGVPINSLVLTPSFDSGDERAQKLYVDSMLQAGGVGVVSQEIGYNNTQASSPLGTLNLPGGTLQFLTNIASLSNLSLWRNISAKFAWTGGQGGPQLYAWEPSGYLQPYVSTSLVTQVFNLAFPGWKHFRRWYPALISIADVTFTIKTQDGRVYGPFTIPSTNGQFRILPMMLPQGIKDLAFAFSLDGAGIPFAPFVDQFVCEVKEWEEKTYLDLAVFRA